jgi:hypothetical protein
MTPRFTKTNCDCCGDSFGDRLISTCLVRNCENDEEYLKQPHLYVEIKLICCECNIYLGSGKNTYMPERISQTFFKKIQSERTAPDIKEPEFQ